MPAAEIIASGGVHSYIAAYNRCFYGNTGRNCYDYAQERLEHLFPSEATISLNAVAAQGREAVSRGQRINRNSPNYVNTTWSPLDPAETLRRANGATPITYEYNVSVAIRILHGDGTATEFNRSVVIIDHSPLSRSEIEQRAIAEAERQGKLWETNSDRVRGGSVEYNYAVRVTGAFRGRD